MPRQRTSEETKFIWNPGSANPKQRQFFESRCLYTAYGGAKGGGKTWAVRTKALLGAYSHAGIRILIMRRTYRELQANHIDPMLKTALPELSSYNGSLHTMYFENGSLIQFGHWQGEASEREYNGQEYDWIFIDEATQFSWRSFQFLGGLLRGTSPVPKRMYLTCNPGGVGHSWVKRLFIDRDFIEDSENPEASENPDDYLFIPATVEDNEVLLEHSPNYLRLLSSMPENLRRAYRYGDWNALGGQYFSEFSDEAHTVAPFRIPGHWRRYRAFDYGLDMFAMVWVCVDGEGRSYVYREFSASGLIARDAVRQAQLRTAPDEFIDITFAPPDMWHRQKDTGKTIADIFFECGMPILAADNDRVQGHMLIKDALAPRADGRPSLLFFRDCKKTVSDLRNILASDQDPNDAAKEPHELTHRVDALRYFITSRTIAARLQSTLRAEAEEAERRRSAAYTRFMTGGAAAADYLGF